MSHQPDPYTCRGWVPRRSPELTIPEESAPPPSVHKLLFIPQNLLTMQLLLTTPPYPHQTGQSSQEVAVA